MKIMLYGSGKASVKNWKALHLHFLEPFNSKLHDSFLRGRSEQSFRGPDH